MLVQIENEVYVGSSGRRSLFDLHIPENFNGKLLVFIHGFKGFKDWGPWNLVDFDCTELGFGFAKFNLTHNGGTSVYAKDFPDLEAFSKNTYSKEFRDVEFFIKHLSSLNLPEHSIHLIGHSRGGGVGLLVASKNPKVSSITTWAAISDIASRMPTGEALEAWRKNGVRFEKNTRTNQDMPIAYELYEDFKRNEVQLNIRTACENLQIPRLLIHGSDDQAVKIEEGKALAEWLKVPLIEIPGANHTFGAVHPQSDYKIPPDLRTVLDLTQRFVLDL